MDALSLTQNAQFAIRQPKALNAPGPNADLDKVHASAKDFEAVFVTQMLGHMFSGLEESDGLFGGGHAEAMVRPMLLEEYGKMIANSGRGIGIADHVVAALVRAQEVQ